MFISLDSQNPFEVAGFLRDFALTLESLAEQGENITQYWRGKSAGNCGGEVKIKWSRDMRDDKQFVQFRKGNMHGYGKSVNICGADFYEEEVETEH